MPEHRPAALKWRSTVSGVWYLLDMVVYGGTVSDAAAALEAAPKAFVAACVERYISLYGKPPGKSEQASWDRSWPELLRALVRAELGGLHLLLEYELPGSGHRVDALLLGARKDGGLTAVVVELKQWSTVDSTSPRLTWVQGTQYTHPCRQAAGYLAYFDDWVDAPDLDLETRAVTYLHSARGDLVDELRSVVATSPGSKDVFLFGRDDVAAAKQPTNLAGMFSAADLRPPEDARVQRFRSVRHRPSDGLLARLDETLSNNPAFRLVGAQQRAHLHVLETVLKARGDDRKQLIIVSGGPGTGKTVIAARLVADIKRTIGGAVFGCYLTQSGTLNQQLKRAVTVPAADGLFLHVDGFARHADKPVVPLVDEAHRLRRNARHVERMLKRTRVCVLFVDERQVIRPNEGYTVAELKQLAHDLDAVPTHIELVGQFRCGGSQRYVTWLEQLLFGHTTATQWAASEYDLDVSLDPDALGEWIGEHTHNGHTARITAGFCWPWTTKPDSTGSLVGDVSLRWTGPDGVERDWCRPWNAMTALQDRDGLIPKSQYWATDEGGHRQVGCIYTAQGLEYEYGAVVFGRDLVRRGDRWVADPKANEDPAIPDAIDPQQYLRLAANTYWVLATRATRGCRLYSVDPETQEYLTGLVRG
ncbi:DNA/RNA helicase domain-containing protein [Kutzneria albida]|uniref:Schlafen group 3-like DNA/RNA helicase domain-containing protein n=1 Tax=Kutzneria albida DSM 43870 TaxID=1449976 RepID=W5WHD6_9PSEU|nr:DNA/RNA helicase domain-containing protein [Kutzneria albida]AHH97589.1 hypothetical protein KALB_4226 [Kutzneria albida DSM 43870]